MIQNLDQLKNELTEARTALINLENKYTYKGIRMPRSQQEFQLTNNLNKKVVELLNIIQEIEQTKTN